MMPSVMAPQSEMRPPWKRITLFLAILLALFAALSHISNVVVPGFREERERIARMLSQADKIEAITLGNSHNLAINFRALGIYGYHLWVPGGDLFETGSFGEVCFSHLPRLHLLFIPLSYPVFHIGQESSKKYAYHRINYTAMRPLAPWRLINGDWRNYLLSWLSPVMRLDHWREAARYGLFGVTPPRRKTFSADGNQIVKKEPWNPVAVDTHSPKYAANRHLKRVEEALAANSDVEELTTTSLRNLIYVTHQRGIRIVFYTPPYTRGYSDRMRGQNPELLLRWARIVRDLIAEEHIDYYDFSDDPRFIDRPDYFMNEDHMSLKGARAFSLQLRRAAGL